MAKRERPRPAAVWLGPICLLLTGCERSPSALGPQGRRRAASPSSPGVVWILRVAVLVLPPLAGAATYLLCRRIARGAAA